jgi:hypothetical protein
LLSDVKSGDYFEIHHSIYKCEEKE